MTRTHKGWLSKRSKGKYYPAETPGINGTFYLWLSTPAGQHPVNLHTTSLATARQRATLLTLSLEAPTKSSPRDPAPFLAAILDLAQWARTRLAQTTPKPIASAFLDDVWPRFLTLYTTGPHTLTAYRLHWRRFHTWALHHRHTTLASITPAIAQTYATHLTTQKHSALREIQTLRRIHRTLLPEAPNPFEKLRLPPRPPTINRKYRRLTHDEILRLDTAFTHHAPHPEYRLALHLAYTYGLRIGSVIALTRADVHPRQHTIYHIPPKTRHRKPLPLSLPLTPAIRHLLRHCPPSGPLLPNLHALYHRSRSRLADTFHALFTHAQISPDPNGHASFHSLRATFITLMDEANAPFSVTDSITGHAPQTMHQRYSQPSLKTKLHWMTRALPPLPPLPPAPIERPTPQPIINLSSLFLPRPKKS